jgi:NADH:ubiquinone oxidoreductase subunit F (NADH-binding)/NADH:ubiquinone oxidoreductase subunit E
MIAEAVYSGRFAAAMIIRELQRIQHARGFLPRDELAAVAERLAVPLFRVHEVASFFPAFRTTPPPEVQVRVCRDMTCRLRGSRALLAECEALAAGQPAGRLAVEGVSCLGRCDRAPAVTVAVHREGAAAHPLLYTGRTPAAGRELVRGIVEGVIPPADADSRFPDGRVWQIDLYDGAPTYAVVRELAARLRTARDEAPRRDVIERLRVAGLLGMGGAGGRTHKKWSDVYTAAGDEKYVVCCGDESEPGTFKDRELLLRTPHLVLEGMLLGGLLVGARRGYVYIRHEYGEQIERMQAAIRDAEAQGALVFPIEVFVSPGGYICGEQTALIEVLEDKRAEPRNRPPELQTNGLWDKPTLVNNVETFAWVPAIVARGGEWFAGRRASGVGGLRFFSVSGDVAAPGVYEVPSGLTLRELIARAGGMRDGVAFKAVAPSGTSGGFLPRFIDGPDGPFDVLDWPLDVADARARGLMLGGGIVVFGEGADLVDQALGALEFFRNESCGKCAPCRIGTQKLVEIGARIADGRVGARDLYAEGEAAAVGRAVLELGTAMKETAICGLGSVAANPMRTLLGYFRDDVERRAR